MLKAPAPGWILCATIRCAVLGFGVLLNACTESGGPPDPCPDTGACAPSNALFDGVWRIEEVIDVVGDEDRAPAIGDIVLYDEFRLRSFGNTDTSIDSLELEAGPVEAYRNFVTEDLAEFETIVSFGGARSPVRIAITAEMLADDVLSVDFETDLTEPTQITLRLVKVPFLAAPPDIASIPLDLGQRAGTFLVTGADRPLPAVLQDSLLSIDLSGRVSAAFGRMPLDPRDFFDPSFVFNRATGREVALQLTGANALGVLGTMSLRSVTLDAGRQLAILVDDGLLDPLGQETVYRLDLTRIADVELCGRVQTGEWELNFFENGSLILDLGDDSPRRSTRLYQAGCEIRIDTRDLILDALDPGAGAFLQGTLEPSARWAPTGTGFEQLGFVEPEFECFFTTTTTFTGTFSTSDGRDGFLVGEAVSDG